jgi:predicted dehydrogenase
MKKIKVGIIGTGSIARNCHMPGYAALGDVEITAVADARPGNAEAAAAQFNVPNVFHNHRQLLANKDIDAVSICTPNAYHKPLAIDALRAGKHVLVEKPMALNATEAKTMVAEAKKAQRLLMIGQNMRFNCESQVLRRAVQAGALGDIYFAEATLMRRRGIPGWGAFTEKKESGAGPLVDLGVHVLDLAMFLMGFPEPVSVSGLTFARLGTSKHEAEVSAASGYWPWNPAKFEVEDLAVGLIRFKNGGCLYLKTCWAANVNDEGHARVNLAGTKGGAQTNPLEIYRSEFGNLMTTTPTKLADRESHREEVRLFIEAIKNNLPSPVPGEEALVVMRILDGIHRSSKLEKEVKLSA